MKQHKNKEIALTPNRTKRNLALFYLSYLLSSRYNNRRSFTYLSVFSLSPFFSSSSTFCRCLRCLLHSSSLWLFGFMCWVLCSLKGRQGRVVLKSSKCSLTSYAHCLSCRARFDVSRRCRGRHCWQQQPPVRSWRQQHGEQTGSERRIYRTIWRCSHQGRKIGSQG